MKTILMLLTLLTLSACGSAGEDCPKGSFGSDARACKAG